MEELFEQEKLKVEGYLILSKKYFLLAKQFYEDDIKNCEKYLNVSLSFIQQSLEVITPYLSLESYAPFATDLSKLVITLNTHNLPIPSKIAKGISKEFTQNVLRNILK